MESARSSIIRSGALSGKNADSQSDSVANSRNASRKREPDAESLETPEDSTCPMVEVSQNDPSYPKTNFPEQRDEFFFVLERAQTKHSLRFQIVPPEIFCLTSSPV